MTGEAISQRDYMRELLIRFGGDRDKVCAAYARAEQEGIVARNRNTHNMPPEDYSAALWEDGVKKGWLTVSSQTKGPDIPPIISPAPDSITGLSVAELLVLHAQIGEELRDRGLAEYLFCRALGWKQAPNSERGYDATGPDGMRYQIKGRRIHRRNKSRQLSAIRDIGGGHFDVLAGVLFDDDFNVMKAALIPIACVTSDPPTSPIRTATSSCCGMMYGMHRGSAT